MRIYIKRPTGKRRSYGIVKLDNGKSEHLHSPALKAINQKVKNNTLAPDMAEKNVQELVDKYKKQFGIEKQPIIHNDDNQRLLAQYWKAEYEHRELADKNTAKYEFDRALKALGNVSLISATKEEIQKALDIQDSKKRRRLTGYITALLKFLGRTDIKLRRPKRLKPKVQYCNETQLHEILLKIEDAPLRILAKVLFYTGMRLGEAFALQPQKIHPERQYIIVDEQKPSKGKPKSPKWDSQRKTFVEKDAFPHLYEWLTLRAHFKLSRSHATKIFKRISGLRLHDLRHSYAIRLLSQGVPLTQVAQCLGNSTHVCEMYYVGFVLVDESIETIKRIMEPKKAS